MGTISNEFSKGEQSINLACENIQFLRLLFHPFGGELTAVKREKFAKNKKNTAKERLSLSLFKV